MGAIEHNIQVEKEFIKNNLYYYLDFTDHVRYTENLNNTYKKESNIFKYLEASSIFHPWFTSSINISSLEK